MLAAKRMREHLALFASLLGVVAIVTGLTVGLSVYLTGAGTAGVRAGLDSVYGADRALRVSLELDADAEAQDREVRELLAETFSTEGRPIAITVDRGLDDLSRIPLSDPELPPAPPTVGTPRARAATIADLDQRAELVDGAWADGADEATIQADAAEALGISAGDRIRLGDAVLTVTGTWRVLDGLDPRWLGDQLPLSGVESNGDLGPIVIAEEAWPAVGTTPRVRWSIVPDTATITAADLDTIIDAWGSLPRTFRDAGLNSGSLAVDGRFVRTANELSGRVDAVRAVQPVALLIVITIAIVTLFELARLLVDVRAVETALVRARGADSTSVALTTAGETAIAAAAGALVGTALAIGGLLLTFGSDTPDALAQSGAVVEIVPIIVVIGTTIVVAGTAFLAARASLRRESLNDSGRRRSIAGLGLIALITVAAAVSVWQFLLYGSPVTPTPGGGTAVDPVAVVAPALALVALVLLGLIGLPALARRVESIAARRPGIRGALAARSVARRVQLAATPLVLIALATGLLVVAAGYSTTWSTSFTQTRELRIGAPVLLDARGAPVTDTTIDSTATASGVTGVAPLLLDQTSLAGEYISVVAAPAAGVRELANEVPGVFEPESVADLIGADVGGPELPASATGITVVASTVGYDAPPTVRASFADRFGTIRSVELDPGASSLPDGVIIETITSLTGTLPTSWSTFAPWRLVALDVPVAAAHEGSPARSSFTLRAISATDSSGDEQLALDESWMVRTPSTGTSPTPDETPEHQGFDTARGRFDYDVRLLPRPPLAPGAEKPSDYPLLPAVISRALADRFEVELGEMIRVEFENTDQPLNLVVTGVVAAVPSADTGLAALVDLTGVQAFQLQSTDVLDPPVQLWVGTTDPDATVPELRAALPAGISIQSVTVDPSQAVLRSAATALWIGAIGAILLAIVAIIAVAGAQLSSRSADVVVLRAIGLGSRDQADIRRREFAMVLSVGIVLGAVAGLIVNVLMVSALARAAVPRPYSALPTALLFDPVTLTVGILVIIVAAAGIVIGYGARVAWQARTLSAREELQ